MPAKSGISHVLASATALLIAPLVKELWLDVIDGEDILRAIETASQTLSEHPYVPTGEDVVALTLTLLTLAFLVYLHGHMYHIFRHGSE